MKDGNLREKAGHLSASAVAAYASGECSRQLSQEIEEHCIGCAECREQLALVLHVCRSEISAEEQQELRPLTALGLDAAAKARQRMLARAAPTKAEDQTTGHTANPSGWRRQRPRSAPWSKRQNRWAYFPPALAAGVLVLALLGALGYWLLPKKDSPLERGLVALRLVYSHSPTEARVTGGFILRPHENLRGAADAKVDTLKLESARFELLRAVNERPSAEAYHALGSLFLLRGEFDEAEKELRQALQVAPRDAQLQADLGALYYERFKRADPALATNSQWLIQAAEYSRRAVQMDPKLPEAWFNLALCDQQNGLRGVAQSEWDEYLKLDPNSPWAAEARKNLKELQAQEKQRSSSEQEIQKEFLSAEAEGDKSAMRRLVKDHFVAVQKLALAAGNLFDEYLAKETAGKKAEAQALLRRLTSTGQLIQEIHGDRFLSDAVAFAQHSDPARKRALQTIRQTLSQADEKIRSGSFEAALTAYASARQAAERLGDPGHLELVIFGLTRNPTILSASRETATLEEQISLKEKLVTDTERRHHLQLQAWALSSLANTYSVSRQHARALPLNLKAVEITKKLGDLETLANALRLAGTNYSRLSDHEQAIKKTFEAVTLVHDYPVSPQRAAQVYSQMGTNLFRAGHYLAALSYHQESVQLNEKIGNPVLVAEGMGHLGITYSMLGRDQEAMLHLRDALRRVEATKDTLSSKILKVELYSSLGELHQRQNKPDEALTTYQQAIAAIGDTTNQFYLPSLHQGLAIAYLAQNKEAAADRELQTSIRMIEQDQAQIADARERSFFLTSRRNVYYTMADFQFTRRGNPALAFDYAERAKSRDLLDAMTGHNELKWSDDRLTLALSGSASPLTLKDVQQALPAHAQLLVYAVTDERLLIWLVTRDTMISESVSVQAADVRRRVAEYLAELQARREIETLHQKAAELYQLLINPMARHLDRHRVLCLIPDDALRQLPFTTLVVSPPHHYLIEDFSMVTNLSASVLAHTLELTRAKPRGAPDTFLGLSDARSSRQSALGLSRLPAARGEIDQAKQFYPHPLILSQAQATESALVRQMGDYSIVHLATHTWINEQSPLLSYILLADEPSLVPADETVGRPVCDGQFRTYEICQQKLRQTRLVILSSCSSGLTSSGGEALSSLAQAFFVAGVPSVIASLWEVEDASTAKLMENFHEQYRDKQQGFSLALRQAQLSFIHTADASHQHPYYWAAFLLTGDGLTSP